MPSTSPCTGLCSFERRTGLCIGCARTSAEITGWRVASERTRGDIIEKLAARRARLGYVRRLAWSPDEIRAFVLATFDACGTWMAGAHGCVGAFARLPGEPIDVRLDADTVSAAIAQASIVFRISQKARAYSLSSSPVVQAWAPGAAVGGLVVMAIARNCGLEASGTGLACLGADREAAGAAGRDEHLYDFGLGDRAGSFGIRTADAALTRSLDQHLGEEWPVFFPAIGEAISRAAPTRVVRNPMGRIEVSTSAWMDQTAGGPFTRFQPDHPRTIESECAVEMADSYLPCAVHYPAAR